MKFNRKSVIVTASADDPAVSTADMKAYLRVDGTADDALIAEYVTTATEAVKEYLRVALRTETFVFTADGFTAPDADDRLLSLGPGIHTASVPYVLGGGSSIDLPYPPLQSVTALKTYDRDNTESTFSSAKYGLDLRSGRVYLNEGETWPTDLRAHNAVGVTYVAGYGAASIPAPIVQAIKLYVSSMYDGTCSGINDEMKRLLAPYRRMDELAW